MQENALHNKANTHTQQNADRIESKRQVKGRREADYCLRLTDISRRRQDEDEEDDESDDVDEDADSEARQSKQQFASHAATDLLTDQEH